MQTKLGERVQPRTRHERTNDSEIRFRAIFDAAFQLMGLLDPDGVVQEVNETTLKVFALERDEVVGRTIWDVFESKLDAPGGDLLKRGVATASAGNLDRFELTATHEGQPVHMDVSMKPVQDDALQVTGIVAEARNVTDLRRADAGLRQSTEQLARAQRIAHLGSWEWDVATGRLSWSEELYRIYGLEPDGAINYERFIALIHPDDRDRVQWLIADAFATRQPLDFDHGIARPDGGLRTIHCEGVVLTDPEGNVTAMAGTGHDITERLAAEHALKVANQELLRRNRELQQFANAASHDLQEPLRKVSSFSELLLTEFSEGLNEEGRFYLERMRDAAMRMSSLIRDLLSFSHATDDGQAYQVVDLGAVMREVLSALEITIKESGARVWAGKLPRTEADPIQMVQLLQNLVSNAIKFTRAGVPAEVHVRGRISRDRSSGVPYCRLSVSDNGIGFDEKYLDRILAPFQRLHAPNEYPGTGMGLAICRRIVQAHGGTISASSRPGIGSTFVVTLPAHR